jgi:PAS domain S-box-containing protein
MNDKPTYQELENQIAELKKQNEILRLNDSLQKEEDEEGKYYFSTILNNIGDPIFVKDDQSRLLIVNDAFCETFGLTRTTIIGKTLAEDVAPDERESFLKIDKQVILDGVENINEESLTVRGGLIQTISTRKTRFINSDGKVFLVGVIRDITERKIAEDKISKSLEEKEVLLRELYHRTKNNMQFISSMLSMQSSFTNNKEVKKIVKETKSKILGMALVHEKLYQTNDLAWIDLKDYITDLVDLLKGNLLSKFSNLEIVTKLENTRTNLDAAIPCGIIINELFTNALKHGFPNNRKGVIKIELINSGDETCISVTDDGVGIPMEVDFKNSNSSGLNLIIMLTEQQLGGSITLDTESATKFVLKFKETIKTDRT